MTREEWSKAKQISFRLTPSELAVVRELAERGGYLVGEGKGLMAFAKAATLGAKVPKPVISREQGAMLADLLRHVSEQLDKVGGNVNQLAKAADEGRGVDSVAIGEAAAALDGLRGDIRALWDFVLLGKMPKAEAAKPEKSEDFCPRTVKETKRQKTWVGVALVLALHSLLLVIFLSLLFNQPIPPIVDLDESGRFGIAFLFAAAWALLVALERAT